jgi:hypothetical protein
MTHPFYRSRLFWIGLPGLMFLLWIGLRHKSLQVGYVFNTSLVEIEMAPEGTQLSTISKVSPGKLTAAQIFFCKSV